MGDPDLEGDAKEQAEALGDAIKENLAEEFESGAYLVHWALVADYVDDDGERHLLRKWSDGMATWEIKGLYQGALDSWGQDEA